ncbi:hypothetical protein N507_2607 [Lacticaseibacillus rhamnosus DSM 14870]|nr:hypothetical protein N507_2607 [Lacticaseibacillus rhamnosus DSM 14870]
MLLPPFLLVIFLSLYRSTKKDAVRSFLSVLLYLEKGQVSRCFEGQLAAS